MSLKHFPSFQNWIKIEKDEPIVKIFGKTEIEFDVNSNGVYGVKCVYDFMVIVCENQLKPNTYGSLWSIYEKFHDWQKDLINNIWSIGIKNNVSVHSIMTSDTYMNELGYAPLKFN